MANIFKQFRQTRQKVMESPFDSPISMQNYDDVEVIQDLEANVNKTKRRRRRSTMDKKQVFKRLSQVTSLSREEVKREKKTEVEEGQEQEEEEDNSILDQIILASDTIETNLEWEKLFPKRKERFSFYWWGDQVQAPEPFPPSLTLKIKQVALGGRHYVALTQLGQVFSWGNGSSGQLGHGNQDSVTEPKLIESLKDKKVRKICSMAAQSVALTASGELYCWGWTGCSEMINTPTLVESLVGHNILQVVLGAYHIAVLVAGEEENSNEVYSWGRGNKGQLGHGDTDDVVIPKSIETLKQVNVLSLASGETHCACITMEGVVMLWGANEDGCLGVGSSEEIVATPTKVVGLDNARGTKIQCGCLFSGVVAASGAIYTWGRNQSGQLGLGTDCSVVQKPQQIKSLSGVSIEGFSCSNNHMVAWTENNQIFTWGSTRNNRLGFETDKKFISTPKAVDALTGQPIFDATCSSRVVIICAGKKLFGLPLEDAVTPGKTLPSLVDECLSFLSSKTREEGLFRISPSESEKDIMISWWNEGYHVNLSNAPCPHLIGALMKNYFQALPEPLMTYELFDQFIALETDSSDFMQKLEGLRVLVQKLPMWNRNVLRELLVLLHKVHCNRESSRMDDKNIAVVFGPVLFRAPPTCVETLSNVQLQTKIIKKLIKYHTAFFVPTSSNMLTAVGLVLIDKNAKKDELQMQQKKIWHACVRSLNDPAAAFVTNTESSGSFSQVLFESEFIDYSIRSAILCYPDAQSVVLLEQLLSLLSDISIQTVTTLLEGLHFVKLPEEETEIVGQILSSYKDIANFGDSVSSQMGIDWNNVTLTEFPLEDEEIKSQLEETERCALSLRQAEQDRQRVSRGSSPAASLKKFPVGKIFAFMNTQREAFVEELENMKRDKAMADEGEVIKDPQQIRLEQCLESLQKEKENLCNQLDEYQKKLAMVEEDLARHTKESSIEQQRYRDELEGIDSNIERKEESLQLATLTAEKFEEFFEGPFAVNNARLMETKQTVVQNILENTGKCPVLIFRYLDANLHVLSELRKKMKRVRKDLKRITRSYGGDAAAAIHSEYSKLKEIFADILHEMEEVTRVYHPILQPVLDWVEFCKEKGVDPATGALLDEYISSALVNTTRIMRDFLVVLLRGFGVFTGPEVGVLPKKFKLSDIISKQEAIEDHVQAIQRRHH